MREDLTEEGIKALEAGLSECDDIEHPLKRLLKTGPKAAPKPEERQKFVPAWWKGETAAYNSAKIAMAGVNALPKMG